MSSPIAARSLSVWYTVRSEMVGISARTAAYTDSAVGWSVAVVQDLEDPQALRA